jgi:protein-L-isoaspartate O-methyltransferase
MTTLKEVKAAFRDVPNAEISEADVHGRVAEVTLSGNLAGQLYKTLRTNDFEFESKRLGNRMVAHIEVEEEDDGLAPLFG